jgi:hemolysin III
MVKLRELSREEELTNAVLHGVGLGLAIAALVVLVVFAVNYGGGKHVAAFSIYGSTLILLYLASTLYHSFPRGKVKDIFRIVDHACVYLLIAGTYTPLALIGLQGTLGWTIFGVAWGLALVGIVYKIFWIKRFIILSTLLYIAMGWMILVAIRPLLDSINTTSLVFLAIGGLAYTLGTIFYGWQKLKYNHAIWHLFVLAGSICHFFTVFFLLSR